MNPAIDVLAVGIGLVLAGCLWLLSEDFFDHYGVTPWDLPSLFWVALVALVVALAVAVPTRAGVSALLGFGVAGVWVLARVTTWNGVVAARDERLRRAQQRLLLAGWFADPARRHERRYFDGEAWTDWVADHDGQGRGVQGRDPLWPQVGARRRDAGWPG